MREWNQANSVVQKSAKRTDSITYCSHTHMALGGFPVYVSTRPLPTYSSRRVHLEFPLLYVLLIEHGKAPGMSSVSRPLLRHSSVVVNYLAMEGIDHCNNTGCTLSTMACVKAWSPLTNVSLSGSPNMKAFLSTSST